MKVILSTILFIVTLFVLPLLGEVKLFSHPYTILSAIVIGLLVSTQSQMKINEVVRDKKTDRGTIVMILLFSVIGHIFAITEWAYFPQIRLDWLSYLGAGLLIFGIVFRIVAIKNLDKAFSSTLQIKKGQQLITNGLYSKFRHPSYTGAWILMLGDALLFQSYIGIGILGIGMFIVYMKRIKAEENMLLDEFGEEYKEYMTRTWKFLPGY